MGDSDIREDSGGEETISRKEALLKAGKYAAFTAASMMLILDSVEGQPNRPPKKSPKPPRESTTKKAVKPTRTDPPPSY